MSNKIFLFTGIIIGAVGWLGLGLLISLTLPTLIPRWLFFFLLVLALSGTALPFIAYLHYRFPVQPPVKGNVILREGILLGIFGSIIIWLLQGRVLTTAIFLLLGIGFIFIEYLLRLRERSHWNP